MTDLEIAAVSVFQGIAASLNEPFNATDWSKVRRVALQQADLLLTECRALEKKKTAEFLEAVSKLSKKPEGN
jgi:hypothetical protein